MAFVASCFRTTRHSLRIIDGPDVDAVIVLWHLAELFERLQLAGGICLTKLADFSQRCERYPANISYKRPVPCALCIKTVLFSTALHIDLTTSAIRSTLKMERRRKGKQHDKSVQSRQRYVIGY